MKSSDKQAFGSQVLQAAFRQLAAMLAARTVAPLPALVHDFADFAAALREFSHARHVGKIVVRVPPPVEEERRRGAPPSPEAWAIAGGLGALGQLTAEWLAGQGTRHIHLLGRSGRWSGPPKGVVLLHY